MSDKFLYWFSGSAPCWRVMIALHEKGFEDFQHRCLSVDKGELKGEEVMKLNPRGQVPILKDSDASFPEPLVIKESMASCLHLEMTHADRGSRLLPLDVATRAEVLQRVFEFLTQTEGKAYDIIVEMFTRKEGERNEDMLKMKKDQLCQNMKLWERYLAEGEGEFIVGNSFSLADIALFPFLAVFVRFGMPITSGNTPKLAEYYDRLKEHPSIKATWPPHYKLEPGKFLFLADIEL